MAAIAILLAMNEEQKISDFIPVFSLSLLHSHALPSVFFFVHFCFFLPISLSRIFPTLPCPLSMPISLPPLLQAAVLLEQERQQEMAKMQQQRGHGGPPGVGHHGGHRGDPQGPQASLIPMSGLPPMRGQPQMTPSLIMNRQ